MSFIYLASPYTHSLESIRISRFEAMVDICALLAKEQIPVYSPIVHWHPVTISHTLPSHDEYWQFHNDVMMTACSEMWILALPGWRESVGVTRETEFIKKLGKQSWYVHPNYVSSFSQKWLDRRKALGRSEPLHDPQPTGQAREVHGLQRGESSPLSGSVETKADGTS